MYTVFALTLMLTPQAFADGASNYSTYCVTCHGESGKGDGVAAAALTPKARDFTDKEWWAKTSDERITQVIKEGGAAVGLSPMMTPWGGVLTDEQVAELVTYLKTFKAAE